MTDSYPQGPDIGPEVLADRINYNANREPPVDSPVVLAHVIAEAIQGLIENTHHHQWDILGVYVPQPNRPIHPRLIGTEQITLVLMRCQECNWVQTIELDGIWTAEQVQGSKQPAQASR